MNILIMLLGPFLGLLGFFIFIWYIQKQIKLEEEFRAKLEEELKLSKK